MNCWRWGQNRTAAAGARPIIVRRLVSKEKVTAHRQVRGRPRARPRRRRRRLLEVAHRLDQREVDAAGPRGPRHLLGEHRPRVVGGERAEGREQLTGRPDVARDEDAVPVGDRPGQRGTGPADLLGPAGETVRGEPQQPVGAEGVADEDAGAGLGVLLVERGDGLGAGEVPLLRTLARGGQAAFLQQPPPATVGDGRTSGEEGGQSVAHGTTLGRTGESARTGPRGDRVREHQQYVKRVDYR